MKHRTVKVNLYHVPLVLANPAVPGRGRTQEDCMGSLLHEVGHIFVGLGHPDENDGMSPLPGTDRTLRLMHSGNRIRGGRLGTVLVKGEWEQAEAWLREEERNNRM